MTDYHQYQVQDGQQGQQGQQEEFTDPYSMFVYAIRSPYTKESYFRRLRKFFDAIDSCKVCLPQICQNGLFDILAFTGKNYFTLHLSFPL